MRLRLALTLAALCGLAGCDQAGQKGSARAPIAPPPPAKTAAATPAATAAAANCPTVAPACPTPRVAHAARRTTKGHRIAAGHKITTTAPPPAHRYAPDDGLPRRPYRYDELPREPEDVAPYEDDYAERAHRPRNGYHRWSREDGYRQDRRHDHGPQRHAYRQNDEGAAEDERYEQRRRDYEGRSRHYGERSDGGWNRRHEGEDFAAPPAPPPPQRHGRPGGYDRYGRAQGGYEHREYRSYSEESSQSSTRTVEYGCCQSTTQAAGFDSRGFLTWPGKTPR